MRGGRDVREKSGIMKMHGAADVGDVGEIICVRICNESGFIFIGDLFSCLPRKMLGHLRKD